MGTEEFDSQPSGISRREALKRGAKLTGAVLWATPVVQAIGMSPALAQTVSPVECEEEVVFRAKSTGNGTFETDPGFGRNDCIDCGGAPGVDGDLYLTIVEGDDTATVTVIDPNCRITSLAAKGGRGADSCSAGVVAADGLSATVTRPTAGGISHVEVCFTCCADV